jgi:hypothetical protein
MNGHLEVSSVAMMGCDGSLESQQSHRRLLHVTPVLKHTTADFRDQLLIDEQQLVAKHNGSPSHTLQCVDNLLVCSIPVD